jgi:hypothetical protein
MIECVAFTWGTNKEDRSLDLPCDRFVGQVDAVYFRGMRINAPQDVIYRWLCQLRAAPYSYDWIDNFGRISPQNLDPALVGLEIGQTVMTIFDLVDFSSNQQLTIQMKPGSTAEKIFGNLAVTYWIKPQEGGHNQLIAKLVVDYPDGLWGLFLRLFLPWGDLIMMRKQLLNLKRLFETEAK